MLSSCTLSDQFEITDILDETQNNDLEVYHLKCLC